MRRFAGVQLLDIAWGVFVSVRKEKEVIAKDGWRPLSVVDHKRVNLSSGNFKWLSNAQRNSLCLNYYLDHLSIRIIQRSWADESLLHVTDLDLIPSDLAELLDVFDASSASLVLSFSKACVICSKLRSPQHARVLTDWSTSEVVNIEGL